MRKTAILKAPFLHKKRPLETKSRRALTRNPTKVMVAYIVQRNPHTKRGREKLTAAVVVVAITVIQILLRTRIRGNISRENYADMIGLKQKSHQMHQIYQKIWLTM